MVAWGHFLGINDQPWEGNTLSAIIKFHFLNHVFILFYCGSQATRRVATLHAGEHFLWVTWRWRHLRWWIWEREWVWDRLEGSDWISTKQLLQRKSISGILACDVEVKHTPSFHLQHSLRFIIGWILCKSPKIKPFYSLGVRCSYLRMSRSNANYLSMATNEIPHQSCRCIDSAAVKIEGSPE